MIDRCFGCSGSGRAERRRSGYFGRVGYVVLLACCYGHIGLDGVALGAVDAIGIGLGIGIVDGHLIGLMDVDESTLLVREIGGIDQCLRLHFHHEYLVSNTISSLFRSLLVKERWSRRDGEVRLRLRMKTQAPQVRRERERGNCALQRNGSRGIKSINSR